jgi:predicted 3-demethylubiquinone-9 3-methyltransferase (glyoxalase superfamily)
MSHSVQPFLVFQGDGSAALDFYTHVFPDSAVEEVERYGKGEAGPGGLIKRARFTIGGQSVLCTDSVLKHAFSFNPSFSFFVDCKRESEVMRLSDVLKAGGSELMPPANIGFSALFAWVSDRFGVSWQLNCAWPRAGG